jgi:hypothetical protein
MMPDLVLSSRRAEGCTGTGTGTGRVGSTTVPVQLYSCTSTGTVPVLLWAARAVQLYSRTGTVPVRVPVRVRYGATAVQLYSLNW